jgi:hypothetical protein
MTLFCGFGTRYSFISLIYRLLSWNQISQKFLMRFMDGIKGQYILDDFYFFKNFYVVEDGIL